MHISLDLNLLDILIIVTGILAIVDSVLRVRGRRGSGIIGIVELIAGALLIVSVFVALPHLLGKTVMEIVLEVVLVLSLAVRGRNRRGNATITIIALVLNTVLILLTFGWITIPGFGLK